MPSFVLEDDSSKASIPSSLFVNLGITMSFAVFLEDESSFIESAIAESDLRQVVPRSGMVLAGDDLYYWMVKWSMWFGCMLENGEVEY